MNNIDSGREETHQKHFLTCPRQQEELLNSIYYNVREAIFVVDLEPDGIFRYVDMNPAGKRLTGIDDLTGKTASELFSPSVAAAIEARYQECCRSQSSITYEECLPLKKKDTWWLTSLNPVKNQAGIVVT